MAVIHLTDRHTKDRGIFEKNLESVSSYIFVNNSAVVDQFEISLTIGDSYTNMFPAREEIFGNIPEEGVLIRPKTAMLFTTAEVLNLPHNIFGVIFPKGSMFIRYAIMIPTTKIDPGFHDNLYIFVQNMGSKPYRIKRGDVIASVSFFSTDSTPSEIRKTQKPSHKGRMPRLRDSILSVLRRIAERTWELLVAMIGGGIVLTVIQKMWG